MSERMKWILGDKHPIYGEVVMMGTTGGEPYRWFEAEDKVIAMIPLSALEEEELVTLGWDKEAE